MAQSDPLARRDMLRSAVLLALLAGVTAPPLLRKAFATPRSGARRGPRAPRHVFNVGKGIVQTPFGELRYAESEAGPLLTGLASASGAAIVDLAQGRFDAVFGTIRLTSTAITIAGKQHAWNEAGIDALIAAFLRQQIAAGGLLNLRGLLLTAGYDYARRLRKAGREARKAAGALLHGLNEAAGASGASAFMSCTETTITETVVTTISETVDIIRTAEEQYQDCLAGERNRGACGAMPPGTAREACAIAICAPKTFFDIVTGTVTVLTKIAEEVSRKVTTCTAHFPPGQWPTPVDLPNPFKSPPGLGDGGKPQTFGRRDTDKALAILRQLPGFDGPLAACLLGANWQFDPLPAAIDLGAGETAAAYGARIALTASCAATLADGDLWAGSEALWLAAISAAAALMPALAAAAAAASIALDPGVINATLEAVLSVSAIVVTIILVVLAVIVVVFTFGAGIALILGAIVAAGAITSGVAIELAAIAAALIALLPPFGDYKGLIAPFVTT